MFLRKGFPYKYEVKKGELQRLPKTTLSPKMLTLKRNAAIRYKKIILEIAAALQKGDLKAYYVSPNELKPISIPASPIWIEQGKIIFTSGRISIKAADGVKSVYRVVINERSFSKWINASEPAQRKLMTFRGTLRTELRNLLSSSATSHRVVLTRRETWELVQKSLPAGFTKASFFADVFAHLPSTVKQAKAAPLKIDRKTFQDDLGIQLARFASTHFPSKSK